MSKETVTYRGINGSPITVEYDPDGPCRICGLPVVEASVGGTDVCPWCDCGFYRDMCQWTMRGLTPVFPHPTHGEAWLP